MELTEPAQAAQVSNLGPTPSPPTSTWSPRPFLRGNGAHLLLTLTIAAPVFLIGHSPLRAARNTLAYFWHSCGAVRSLWQAPARFGRTHKCSQVTWPPCIPSSALNTKR